MPSATTEIAVLTLIPGCKVGDPENPAAAVVKESGNTLLQTGGMQQLQFGHFVESADMLQLFIDWDSLQHHKTFMASDAYGPFLKRFRSIMAAAPEIVHVDFQGGLKHCLSAPVTEVATFYFDGEPPKDYLDGPAKLAELMRKDNIDGFIDMACGITVEEMEREGVKGKAAILTIGWQSVDHHMKLRESQFFKDNIHLLRSEAKKIEMHHVAFMNFVG